MNISRKIKNKVTIVALIAMLGAVMLPLTANAFLYANFSHIADQYDELVGSVYTKDPHKVRVKITEADSSVTEVTYNDNSGLYHQGYDDNNVPYWGVSFYGIDSPVAPSSIQVSDDDGGTWTMLDAFQDNDVNAYIDKWYNYTDENTNVRLSAYRIQATETYTSVTSSVYNFLQANTAIVKGTPSDDLNLNMNLTAEIDTIGFDFGADNVLQWSQITKDDFVVIDLSNNTNVPVLSVKPYKVNNYSNGTVTDSTRILIVNTATNLVSGHEYALGTSNMSSGNEIKTLPNGTYSLSLAFGTEFTWHSSYFNKDFNEFSYTNVHFFDDVTIANTDNSNGNGSGYGNVPIVTQPQTQPEVKPGDSGVEFKPSAESVKTETTTDGKQKVTVTLKSEDLNKAFDSLGSNTSGQQTISINVDQKGDSTKVNLPAGLLAEKSKTKSDVVIAVRSDDASINIPLQAVNYDAVASQLGVGVSDVTISVSMTAPTAAEDQAIRNQAKERNINIVNIVNFTVTAEGGGKSQEITNFGSTYIPRTIAVSEQTAGKQYMAVIIDSATGELQFIPASIDAKGNIVIMAPHASVYAIVEKANVTFTDIKSHWAKADIEALASKLLVKGTSADSFSPDKEISRAEFTSLIARALGLEMVKSDTAFTDVAANSWYAKAVRAAVQAGIVKGRTDTTFAPDATISREEMSVMIARALTFVGKQTDVSAKQASLIGSFADNADIAEWAQASVAQSVNAQIMRGDTKGKFNPKGNATRADAVVALKRLLENINFLN